VTAALAGCGSGSNRRSAEPQPVTISGIEGLLVEPSTSGRHPGVVVVHGAGGDRRELLGQARALARQGVVALTITEPSTADPLPPASSLAALLDGTRRTQLRDAAAVRTAAHYLAGRVDVDPKRLGYLGWSAGAKTGTFVTGTFRALALLSAGADTVSSFAAAAPPSARAQVRRALRPVDPITAISGARPGTILLEDGRRDRIVPRRALENVVHAAPARTTVRWYDAGHALNRRAWADARAWLVAKLSSA
jgi:dienelactone hydrolase